jgi:hypothetical protein
VTTAKEAGFDVHVAKPPSVEALEDAIEQIKARAHREEPARTSCAGPAREPDRR